MRYGEYPYIPYKSQVFDPVTSQHICIYQDKMHYGKYMGVLATYIHWEFVGEPGNVDWIFKSLLFLFSTSALWAVESYLYQVK